VFLQVYKSIFTLSFLAQNILDEENNTENMPPIKLQKTLSNNSVHHNVASKLHLNDKVTPQSVAYSAIQVCVYIMVSYFVPCLSWTMTTSSISTCKLQVHYGEFDYQGLHNYVVNLFEDTPGPAAKKYVQELLNWWSM